MMIEFIHLKYKLTDIIFFLMKKTVPGKEE